MPKAECRCTKTTKIPHRLTPIPRDFTDEDGFCEWEQVQAPTHSSSTPPVEPSGEHDMVSTTKDNIPQRQHGLSVSPPPPSPSRHVDLQIISHEEEEEVNLSVASWSMINGDGANPWILKKAISIGKVFTNGALKLAARVNVIWDSGGDLVSRGCSSFVAVICG
ncbi:hypothetical protein V6N13_017118 [Hibiscus sabdariffa]|uniref:Uncharacterized protein n=1 Tax=Hibiscus sabdariffa TaxID=183260 RepID=A0ABR2CYZ4_9ROSI